jgi:hypothetical protein
MNLTSIKQLGISFLTNWIFWLLGSLLGDTIVYEEQHSLTYHFSRAAWMSCCMTVFFNWEKTKALFRHNKN